MIWQGAGDSLLNMIGSHMIKFGEPISTFSPEGKGFLGNTLLLLEG